MQEITNKLKEFFTDDGVIVLSEDTFNINYELTFNSNTIHFVLGNKLDFEKNLFKKGIVVLNVLSGYFSCNHLSFLSIKQQDDNGNKVLTVSVTKCINSKYPYPTKDLLFNIRLWIKKLSAFKTIYVLDHNNMNRKYFV